MKLHTENIYLHAQPIDFRKSINGLSIILSSLLDKEIEPGVGCLFYNYNRNKLKLLYFEVHGACLWQKRLSNRRFKLNVLDSPELIEICSRKFNWLRSGLDLSVFDVESSKDLLFF